MKVIIAGSRDGVNHVDVLRAISASGWRDKISEIVCGDARGADSYGRHWALGLNVPVKDFPADWTKHGKPAGPIRNSEMANYADALILVWDGKSDGSADMLRKAQKAGLQIFEWVPERYREEK